MRNAICHHELDHIQHFFQKTRITRTLLEISRCRRAKQWQRNVQISVLHVQSCFLAN